MRLIKGKGEYYADNYNRPTMHGLEGRFSVAITAGRIIRRREKPGKNQAKNPRNKRG